VLHGTGVRLEPDLGGLVTVEAWLAAAVADAEKRGLPDLKPLLEALAKATAALRASKITRSC